MSYYSKQRIGIDDSHYLELGLFHTESKYKLAVSQYKSLGDGLVETCPFDDGNFNIVICTGRKSDRKLRAITDFVVAHKQELFDLWSNGNYEAMCQMTWQFGRSL